MQQRPRRILVVDDETRILDYLRLALSKDDRYRVQLANGPTKVLEMMRRSSFDLVLSDVHMPEMKGTTLLCKLKAAHPTVAVVLMSGEESGEAARAAGAAAYLQKPFTKSQLIDALESALEAGPDVDTLRRHDCS